MKISKILIFNFFTRDTYKGFKWMHIFGRRLNSMFMDFNFMLRLVFPYVASLFFPIMAITEMSNGENPSLPDWTGIMLFSMITFVIINKDFFNARSVAKRYYGYQVVDAETNNPASELQCVIRNSTMIIWPLEVLITMVNSKRRFGDLIAGTKLNDVERKNPESIMTKISAEKKIEKRSKLLLISILISLLFSVLTMLPNLLIMN